MRRTVCLAAVMALLVAGGAQALSLGQNITIFDGMGSGTGWYGTQEDQEVEPGNQTGQQWDLEGFFLRNTTLTLVSGFDLENGAWGNGRLFRSGDLFLDIDGDAQYGPANTGTLGDDKYPAIVQNTFGYDYVLTYRDASDAFGNPMFDVYALDADSTTVRVWYTQNDESNPWRYNDGGTLVYSGSFNYFSGLSDADVGGLLGGNHYAAQVDLMFLFTEFGHRTFTSHFTIECGNDNLMGRGTMIVPEPASFALLGLGLAAMACRAALRKI